MNLTQKLQDTFAYLKQYPATYIYTVNDVYKQKTKSVCKKKAKKKKTTLPLARSVSRTSHIRSLLFSSGGFPLIHEQTTHL